MNKTFYLLLVAAAVLTLSCKRPCVPGTPMGLIFETDMGNDVDDALAADMLFKYQQKGCVELLGIGLNKVWEESREYLDILTTWYGCPELPLGVLDEGASYADDENCYTSRVCRLKGADGNPFFARSRDDYASLSDAVGMYRRLLSGRGDASVDIVSVGFSTNLARLVASGPDAFSPLSGEQLVAAKVRRLVVMGGNFDGRGFAEFNIVKDIPSAKAVLENWPGEVVLSPFELGEKILFPGAAVEAVKEPTPVTEGYKAFQSMPYDRPSWDLTAVLYAVEGPGNFLESPYGRVTVTDNGETLFEETPTGNCKYLMVSSEGASAIRDRLVELFEETYVR